MAASVNEPAPKVRVGLKLQASTYPVAVHEAVWQLADGAGFDHFWLNDHLAGVEPEEPGADVYDGWTLLAAMAATTHRVRLGLLVAGNLYRHPAQLAKIATTVDHISRGRLELGLGTAWNEPEFAMFGLDFPSARERVERLDEACVVLRSLWAEAQSNYVGHYYQLTQAVANPKPLQQLPPLWIGGSGRKRMLPLIARHADVWNISTSDVDEAMVANHQLQRCCEELDRDPATLRRSVQFTWIGRDDTLRLTQRFVRAGFTDIVLVLRGVDDPRRLAEVASRECLPRIHEMG